jgi:Na+/proline symporter
VTLFFIIIYLIAQIAVGYLVSKRIKTEGDFFLAGRNLPTWMVSMSLFATWFGAETCIGSSAAVYEVGLSGSRADPFGYTLCLVFMGLLLAARLWRGGYTTLADFYRDSYGSFIEKFSVWILFPSSLFWAAAQIRAFGQVVAASTSLPVETAIIGAAIFVIIYTLMGGLLGDIITDVLQGLIVAIGLAAVFILTFQHIPDLSTILSQMSPERLSIVGEDESWFTRLDRWAVPVLGSLVAQELISRVLASKNAKVAVRSSYISAAMYLMMGSLPVFLGLIGPQILPGLEDSEQFLVSWANTILPPVFFTIFAGALISAILATIDSILLSLSALLTHNILIPALKVKDDKTKLKLARLVVIASGTIAFAIAMTSDSIYDLVETASAFGTSGVLVITLAALVIKNPSAWAAGFALTVGIVTTPLAEHAWQLEAPFISSILAAGVAFALGHFFDPLLSRQRATS